jgi:hypothetical protein
LSKDFKSGRFIVIGRILTVYKGSEQWPLDVGFEVFTVVTMKNAVFWDVAPIGSCRNSHFRGTYPTDSLLAIYYGFSSLTDFFYPEDGGDMFLRNVGSYKTHKAIPWFPCLKL